jgi:hypothetical protein
VPSPRTNSSLDRNKGQQFLEIDMTNALAAALLFAAGLAAAQPSTPASGAAPAAQSGEVKKQDNSAQKAQLSDLNAQEKAAMEGVTGNAALSKADSNAAKRKIHADFKTKKDTIRAQMKVDRKSKRADIPAERGGVRKDRQDRRETRPGGKQSR